MKGDHSVLIIGAGLLGLATAYKLLQRNCRLKIIVVEKEGGPGLHQSTRNSGVMHAGLYYRPGSYKARLAVEGIRELASFCERESIPYEICGKLVVATSQEQLPRLDLLFSWGIANGLQGLRRLEPAQMRKIEPYVGGIAGIHVPEEGIVDYRALCERLAKRIQELGATVQYNAKVLRLNRTKGQWAAETTAGTFVANWLINCAGLHSDRIARLCGLRPKMRIVPFRGEYHSLRPERQYLVKNLIYPVPDPRFPFLGVHFTRLIQGGIEAGPNAVVAFAREGYTFWTINMRDLWEILTFPGLWRFLLRHKAMVCRELSQSIWPPKFYRALQSLVPEVQPSDFTKGRSGVRAQAMRPDGTLVEDFEIMYDVQGVHVLNAPSPAATACLAIGKHIASLLHL